MAFSTQCYRCSLFTILVKYRVNLVQNKEQVKINQDYYISGITPIEISKDRSLDSELTNDEKAQLKRLSGKMIWAASQTRPDISYETCVMSNTGKRPTAKMIKEANKDTNIHYYHVFINTFYESIIDCVKEFFIEQFNNR